MTAAAEAPLPVQRRREVVRQGLWVGLATGAYGISFGALSVAAGLSVAQTQVLSLLLFSGGSQFAVVGVLGAGGSPVAAVATSTLLGVRNGLYALRTSRFLGVDGVRRLLAAHVTIDESTAVGTAQAEGPAQRLGFWVTGLTVFSGWNLMTLAGALVGNALGDPRTYGLDAAAAAAFAALLWPRLRDGDAAATAVLAVAVALLASPVLPAGLPVVLAGLAAVAVGLRPGRRPEPAP
ncbi:AzlC family ABC transporter permease [Phycicoccus flavus]|uniref:AzlC family ABC transporter permease n=1 Tax=Phycicoccus flavus TaxID=2502783 RepID=UPI000FEBC076|nr:AzlC family ABC transporter permease [Phycicoccus flavus]NHA69025.1 AzlC family ABC transporter permease [Phycicoccus flavus]